ncbi:MAG: hypothetical protein IJI37_02300, partial [Opitutales bacterium]|nr:hypothetical protein [Opitutales bacterium]
KETTRIKIGENANLQINSIAVDGDVYDDDGKLLCRGRVVRLGAGDVARLGITDARAISDRYNGEGE